MKKKKIVFVSFLMVGCGENIEEFSRKHEQACREQVRVFIYDSELWDRYQEAAEAEGVRSGVKPLRRFFANYAPGFEERFGTALTATRDVEEGLLVRNDITILHDGVRVARGVDVIAIVDGVTHKAGFNCLSYPELYERLIYVTS